MVSIDSCGVSGVHWKQYAGNGKLAPKSANGVEMPSIECTKNTGVPII